MKILSVGMKVDVGGCVGKIDTLTDVEVSVSGRYRYPETDCVDNWTFVYDRKAFEACPETRWGDIDARDLEYKREH